MGLNYAAEVPMDLDAPVSAPSVALPVAAQQAAISDPDFIINKRRLQKQARNPRQTPSQERNVMPRRVINEGVEWRPHNAQVELNQKREEKLEEATKKILSLHVNAMKKYRRAEKYLAGLSKDEAEYPSERTIKMRRIVAKGPPITKAEARTQAYEQLVKFGW